MKPSSPRFTRIAILTASLVALSSFALASEQNAPTPPGIVGVGDGSVGMRSSTQPMPRTFGTVESTVYTVHAFGFENFDGTTVTSTFASGAGGRTCSVGCVLEAPIMLPAGALLTDIELEGCDENAAGEVILDLFRLPAPNGDPSALGGLTTGESALPGWDFFGTSLSSPETIDNFNNSYLIQVVLSGGGASTQFNAVRVYYNLQISPAPVTATFGDVPTSHPFFQHVEALAGSGVTLGCTPTLYCPSATVTRGQMAAFLSRALGLHWAP